MSDPLSPSQRHLCMSHIRGRDTKPEILVRKFLWRHGFRYRLNHPRLPGKPDIVLRQYRTCIFVNGCFWHGHGLTDSLQSSMCCKVPKTNREFWVRKISRNMERDAEVKLQLQKMGWNCITVWECELKPDRKEATLASLLLTLSKIMLGHGHVKRYPDLEESTQMMVADDADLR